MRPVRISPSILSGDFSELGGLVELLERSGADSLHLDVMDGHFVRNISFGPAVIGSIRPRTKLPFNVHLMIDRPDLYVEQFGDAGSDMLIIHREAPCSIHETIDEIKKHEMDVGISLNPDSDFESVIEFLPKVDLLLIMSVVPGFGGQRFVESSIAKIRKARKYIDQKKLDVVISVDGGINLENAARVREAGADEIVAGTAITGSKDIKKTIKELRG